MDYAALKTELQSDPSAQGYALPMAVGDDVGTAAILNTVRSGPTPAAITIFRSRCETWEVFACLVKPEWDALSAGDKQLFSALMGLPFINTADSRVRALFGALFGPATTTRANLLAMAQSDGTRAEQLFGEGTSVSASDIAKALRG